MRLFSREATGYAVLLIVLFSIATLAVWHTISYLEENVADRISQTVTLLITTITFGFMLIAGAFGLWAIQFSAESESRRRIGRLVDDMDFLPDSILAVDERGRVTGSNPATASLLGAPPAANAPLLSLFSCLTTDDRDLLMHKANPNEVEREFTTAGETRNLRFRSQPSEGLSLILVSDVTAMHSQRRRRRQIAQLQVIGQLARGVAHDFNNLLCGISGYASLLERLPADSPDLAKALREIKRGSERGVALAAHLLQLSQPATSAAATDIPSDHARTAVDLLRDSLPPGWTLASDVSGPFPPVGLTGIQLEQAILNLGLLAADAVAEPGSMKISLLPPDPDRYILNVGSKYAAVLLVTTTGNLPRDPEDTIVLRPPAEAGAIESLIRSLLEEAGGGLDCLIGSTGAPLYRAALPRALITATRDAADNIPPELLAYVANWSVILAGAHADLGPLDNRMQKAGIKVSRVHEITSVLASIEEDSQLDALVIDEQLLGAEAAGLLRAILKLHPSAGIVVLSETPEAQPESLRREVIFEPSRSTPDRILMAMVEARGLAIRRKQA